ncbi:hypothetical protein EV356DRAFT_327657 [Viridothelium virens]|uniref:Uncharacterized protein n=1 Tax=Viridothelium virens TaxID=1048519 RepID=A0A6A6GXU9_VIRVR|nr:hypothetical protein EV356DRAFT_327657 [Viridothelium virens]
MRASLFICSRYWSGKKEKRAMLEREHPQGRLVERDMILLYGLSRGCLMNYMLTRCGEEPPDTFFFKKTTHSMHSMVFRHDFQEGEKSFLFLSRLSMIGFYFLLFCRLSFWIPLSHR